MTTSASRCERCETPLERGDLRCSICGLAAPFDGKARTEVETQILRCTGCGAAVRYDPAHRAPACGFCGSIFHLETVADPVEQTRGYLPFTVAAPDARASLRGWLGSLGWFRPADLTSAARVESLKPLWWVAWVFDAKALVSWAADSNAGSGRSAWAPHAGQTEIEFDDILVSASRGLTDEEVTAIGSGYDLGTVREEPEGADGATLEEFDVQRSQARERIVDAIQHASTGRVTSGHVPGSKYRNVHVAVLLRGFSTRRLAFPAYVMAYRYRDRLYRAVVNGQDATRVRGVAPYSVAKITIAVIAAIAVLGAVAGIVLASL